MQHDEPPLARLWAEIRDSDLDDDARRRERIERVIDELRALPTLEREPSALYLLGYATYMHPDRGGSFELQQQVEHALHRVLELVPDDPLSLLYLAHHDYDLGRYEAARDRLAAIDRSKLPDYLSIKTHEMIACCALQLSGVAGSGRVFEEFVDDCAMQPELMQVDPPLNLLRLLDRKVIEDSLEPLRAQLGRLDALCGVRWFSEHLDAPR